MSSLYFGIFVVVFILFIIILPKFKYNHFGNEGTKRIVEDTKPIEMRYGVPGKWVTKTWPAGSHAIECNPTTFGSDPAFGVKKTCEIWGNPYMSYDTSNIDFLFNFGPNSVWNFK